MKLNVYRHTYKIRRMSLNIRNLLKNVENVRMKVLMYMSGSKAEESVSGSVYSNSA
jgi:hypothetical protein